MNPNAYLESLWSWLGDYAWILQIFLLVLLTLVAGGLVRRLVEGIRARAGATRVLIDDALFTALVGPARGLIWIVGISLAAEIVALRAESPLLAWVGELRQIGIVAMISWFIVRFIRRYQDLLVEQKVAAGEEVDRTFVDAVGKLLRAAVIITAVLIVLQTLGINIAGVVAFGGVGGIAIGFAARDLMANFFGGLTIYLDRPFAVGDWIRSPDREIEGTVEEIGWRRTAIRTFDKRILYVPNAVFTTISVENPSRMTNRRIKETIGVRYDDAAKVPAILQDVRDLLREDEDIDQSKTLMVNFDSFGPSSMDFFIYTFTRTTVWTEYHAIKERILLEIGRIIDKHGAEVAFPTRTLHVPEGLELLGSERQSA